MNSIAVAWSYEQVTAAAIERIERLTQWSLDNLDEDNQSYWDQACGVLAFWHELTEGVNKADDVLRLDALVDAMPHTAHSG